LFFVPTKFAIIVRMSNAIRKSLSTRNTKTLFFPDEEPEEEKVAEHFFHFRIRQLLIEILQQEFGQSVLLGSDQFVYWDAHDPKKNLSPDVMLRRNTPHEDLGNWKVWERGAPHIAVEIISPSDASERAWKEKLARYNHVGVQELVRFDPNDDKRPLRIWQFVEHKLVERAFKSKAKARSLVLDLWWVVMIDKQGQKWLRLSRDPFGREMLQTRSEKEQSMRQALEAKYAQELNLREAAEQHREQEQRRREAAEQRIRELEAQLRTQR